MIAEGSYSTKISKKAYPAATIKFIHPVYEDQSVEVEALIDSGASATLIPESVADQLALVPINKVVMRDFQGQVVGEKNVYHIKVTIDSLDFDIDVAETAGFAIIGRDILNKINTTLYGIRQKWEMKK